MEVNEGYQWGCPPEPGIYKGSIDLSLDIPDTLRYYWNGKYWSECWHITWPNDMIERAKASRSSWPERYWKKIET